MTGRTPDERRTGELLRILEKDESQVSERKDEIRERMLAHFDDLVDIRSTDALETDGPNPDEVVLELSPLAVKTHPSSASNGPRWLAAAAVIAAVVAGAWLVLGLGADDGQPLESGVVDEPDTSGDSASLETGASATGPVADSVALPAGTVALQSLGGIQLDLSTPSRALVSQQCVFVFGPNSSGLGFPSPFAFVGQIGFTNTGEDGLAPISSIDEWVEFIEEELGEAPSPMTETVELFGQSLAGYSIEAEGFTSGILHQFNCAEDAGTPSGTGYFPFGSEEWFVVERNGGLLVVASGGGTSEAAQDARSLRNEIVESIAQVDSPAVFSHAPVAEPGASPTLLELSTPDISGGSRTHTLPAMSGVQFDADESHVVTAFGDGIVIDPIGTGGAFIADVARLGLTTQAADGDSISTTTEFLAELQAVRQLRVEPNGQFVELFGRELVGYTVEVDGVLPLSNAIPSPSLQLFALSRDGAAVVAPWAPQRTQLFLADTPAGVLYAGFDVNPYVSEPPARTAFATLLASAELTGPGLDAPLPDGATFGGADSRPEAVAVNEDGPPGYFGQFSNGADIGRFQLQNFAAPISVNITGWGVEQNQAGLIGLVGESATATTPGQRSVVMVAGLQPTLTPQAGGPSLVGEPVDLSDIEAFLDAPPANLEVSNVSRPQVGGLDTYRFDVRVASGLSCTQDEPCEYAFQAAWELDFPIAIRAETAHRIWWIPDHPAGPSMIMVSDPNPNFLDVGTVLVESIEEVG